MDFMPILSALEQGTMPFYLDSKSDYNASSRTELKLWYDRDEACFCAHVVVQVSGDPQESSSTYVWKNIQQALRGIKAHGF